MGNIKNIDYEINLDDIKAYLTLNYDDNPKIKQSRKRMFRLILPMGILVIILAVTNYFMDKESPLFAVIIGIIGIFCVLLSLFLIKIVRGAVVLLPLIVFRQRPNKAAGNHKLTISADAVNDISEVGESTTNWKGISWFNSNNKYLFLSVHGGDFYIIPRRAFPDDASFMQFIDTAQEYYRAATVK
jgi:hypothetical protein